MQFHRFHLWGLSAALLAFISDQWSKAAILKANETGLLPINVTSFFDIVMAWNPGISFSFLSNSGQAGRYALILLSIILSFIFFAWMIKSTNFLFILAMGFIIGGALGNGIDRLIHGQVVDFLYFHYQKYSFPVFNIADCAITIGGFLYIYVLLFAKDSNAS